jgi:hypothetical protein
MSLDLSRSHTTALLDTADSGDSGALERLVSAPLRRAARDGA